MNNIRTSEFHKVMEGSAPEFTQTAVDAFKTKCRETAMEFNKQYSAWLDRKNELNEKLENLNKSINDHYKIFETKKIALQANFIDASSIDSELSNSNTRLQNEESLSNQVRQVIEKNTQKILKIDNRINEIETKRSQYLDKINEERDSIRDKNNQINKNAISDDHLNEDTTTQTSIQKGDKNEAEYLKAVQTLELKKNELMHLNRANTFLKGTNKLSIIAGAITSVFYLAKKCSEALSTDLNRDFDETKHKIELLEEKIETSHKSNFGWTIREGLNEYSINDSIIGQLKNINQNLLSISKHINEKINDPNTSECHLEFNMGRLKRLQNHFNKIIFRACESEFISTDICPQLPHNRNEIDYLELNETKPNTCQEIAKSSWIPSTTTMFSIFLCVFIVARLMRHAYLHYHSIAPNKSVRKLENELGNARTKTIKLDKAIQKSINRQSSTDTPSASIATEIAPCSETPSTSAIQVPTINTTNITQRYDEDIYRQNEIKAKAKKIISDQVDALKEIGNHIRDIQSETREKNLLLSALNNQSAELEKAIEDLNKSIQNLKHERKETDAALQIHNKEVFDQLLNHHQSRMAELMDPNCERRFFERHVEMSENSLRQRALGFQYFTSQGACVQDSIHVKRASSYLTKLDALNAMSAALTEIGLTQIHSKMRIFVDHPNIKSMGYIQVEDRAVLASGSCIRIDLSEMLDPPLIVHMTPLI